MQEAPPAYVEEATAIEAVGYRIPAVLARPASGAARSAILLVPGSLYLDVDGNMPMFDMKAHAYADLARQLAARGHAVLRYAKRGPGTGSEVIDSAAAAANRTFRSRVDVLESALRVLTAAVPGRPVVLAGHSEGAVVVLKAVAEGAVADGVVSLSGPSVGILDIMREQLPLPPGSPATAYAAYDAAVADLRAGGPLPALDPNDPTLMSLAYIAQSGDAGIRYMVEVDAADPVALAANVPVPVLLVQGGRDASVPTHHADALERARTSVGLPTERAFFPTLTHFYKDAPDGMDPMQAFALTTESDRAVAEAIAGWIERTLYR